MASIAQLTAKIAQFFTASDKAHQLVNGADNETVDVTSGALPTFAKLFKDFEAKSVRYDLDQTGISDGLRLQAQTNLRLNTIFMPAEKSVPYPLPTVRVSGVTADFVGAPVSGILTAKLYGEAAGKPNYQAVTPGWIEGVAYSGSRWELFHGDSGLAAFVAANGNEATPDLAGGWTAQGSAAGAPVFELFEAIPPEFIGQLCIVGDDTYGNGNYLEFRCMDGISWTLTGPAGVIEDNEALGNFRRIIFDGGALSSEPYTLS